MKDSWIQLKWKEDGILEYVYTLWECLMALQSILQSIPFIQYCPRLAVKSSSFKAHHSDPWFGVYWRCWSSGRGHLCSPPPTEGLRVVDTETGTSHTLRKKRWALNSCWCTVNSDRWKGELIYPDTWNLREGTLAPGRLHCSWAQSPSASGDQSLSHDDIFWQRWSP